MTQYVPTYQSSYAGNDSTQTITFGWQPAAVFVSSGSSAGNKNNRAEVWKFDTMSSSNSAFFNDDVEYVTNGVTLTATGFSVDASTSKFNQSGTTDHFIAIRQGPWVQTGTYTGDGAGGGQTITLGRQPQLLYITVTVNSGVTKTMHWKSDTMASTTSVQKQFNVDLDNSSVTLTSTGFTVATDNSNESGTTYTYCACFFHSPTIWCRSVQYSGDGTTGRAVALGVQPKWGHFGRNLGGTNGVMYTKPSTLSSGDYRELDNNHDLSTSTDAAVVTSTGYTVTDPINASGSTYDLMSFVR